MGYFAPLIFSVVTMGLLALFSSQASVTAINSTQAKSRNDGQAFLAYRDAVMSYWQNNPGFIGVIPNNVLLSTGRPFSTDFLQRVGNVIVNTGGRNGRAIICYGTFNQSVAFEAAQAAGNDASFGVSSGPTWSSVAVGLGNTSILLPTLILPGNIVSVITLDL
ncbi:hypothetical protein ICN10_01600 [Polynucleobacter sp. 86C-FISCH]|uniref:hypothetical protein n=1 Tax=Polynucleobacter sp. 86C-FISCH TaxID=2689101 RepID=UPI001C0AE627|nr:hypothetical protein [Polynucleobacter sp. 86C-FISCH]MBU3595091.1 hypothetical protein [Polynucleobacter sp. 86C-FISCH]